jgi:predicted transcriptional regulator YheO
VVRKITNSQLSFKESGKRFTATVLSILKDLSTFEHRLMRAYNRRAQLDYTAFRNLAYMISNFALKNVR